MSCFYGSSNSDAAVFRNAAFGEFKDHSLKRTPFQKKFAVEVLGMQLPYIKRYFQEYQWSSFLFMAQITQILFLSRVVLLEISKITVWERDIFKEKLPFKFQVCVYLPWKGIFRSTSKVLFWFWLKYIWLFCFWECHFWRDQRSQFESDTFSRKKNLWKSRDCMYLMWKRVLLSTSEALFQITFF